MFAGFISSAYIQNMSEMKPKQTKTMKMTREERLAKTLRDNLRRRKQAAKKSSAPEKALDEKTSD